MSDELNEPADLVDAGLDTLIADFWAKTGEEGQINVFPLGDAVGTAVIIEDESGEKLSQASATTFSGALSLAISRGLTNHAKRAAEIAADASGD